MTVRGPLLSFLLLNITGKQPCKSKVNQVICLLYYIIRRNFHLGAPPAKGGRPPKPPVATRVPLCLVSVQWIFERWITMNFTACVCVQYSTGVSSACKVLLTCTCQISVIHYSEATQQLTQYLSSLGTTVQSSGSSESATPHPTNSTGHVISAPAS